MVKRPKKKGNNQTPKQAVCLRSGMKRARFDAIAPYRHSLCSSSLQQPESNETKDKKLACVQLKFKAIIRTALFMSIMIQSRLTNELICSLW